MFWLSVKHSASSWAARGRWVGCAGLQSRNGRLPTSVSGCSVVVMETHRTIHKSLKKKKRDTFNLRSIASLIPDLSAHSWCLNCKMRFEGRWNATNDHLYPQFKRLLNTLKTILQLIKDVFLHGGLSDTTLQTFWESDIIGWFKCPSGGRICLNQACNGCLFTCEIVPPAQTRLPPSSAV